MVDAPDLKSEVFGRAGSSPAPGTLWSVCRTQEPLWSAKTDMRSTKYGWVAQRQRQRSKKPSSEGSTPSPATNADVA